MTLLSYVGGTPGFELFVCGAPSREWLEWVRTTAVPLHASQVRWRVVAQARVDALGLGVEPLPPPAPLPELPAEPVRRRGRPSRNPYGRPSRDKNCPHRYLCDQCGQCERCDCYDCPL